MRFLAHYIGGLIFCFKYGRAGESWGRLKPERVMNSSEQYQRGWDDALRYAKEQALKTEFHSATTEMLDEMLISRR